MTTNTYFADYPGELTPDDRTALERPGFRLYVDGRAVSKAFTVGTEEAPEFTTHQVVRLNAESPEHARQQIVDALGREPAGLTIVEGKTPGS